MGHCNSKRRSTVEDHAVQFSGRRKSSAAQICLAHLSEFMCKFRRSLQPSNCGLVILTSVRCDLFSAVPAQNLQGFSLFLSFSLSLFLLIPLNAVRCFSAVETATRTNSPPRLIRSQAVQSAPVSTSACTHRALSPTPRQRERERLCSTSRGRRIFRAPCATRTASNRVLTKHTLGAPIDADITSLGLPMLPRFACDEVQGRETTLA